MKFIFISGGVISGLGKGVTTASLALLLKSRGIKTTCVKCDMYLNIDAGTMNPLEHGEVFVTHDGLETDQDLGHYERFLQINHTRVNYMTNGQIYKVVLDRERSLEYDGACVQPYHHIPPEIIKRWYEAGKVHNSEVVLVEFGGTVGEYEGLLFFEAARRLKLKNPQDVCFVHVGYLPAPPSIGELKSKPLQQSIYFLNSLGIQPDFIIARAEQKVDNKRKEKIALASGVPIENVISNPDVKSVYEVPLVLKKERLDEKIINKFSLKTKGQDLKEWSAMLDRVYKSERKLKIAIVGKYQKTGDYILEDSYVCVVEALKHASSSLGLALEMVWIDSESIEKCKEKEVMNTFDNIDGIIVPQGWGKRGSEGKIVAVNYARNNKIPYLGLCFGMQMASIEFARNVLGLKDANSTEIDPNTKYPIVHVMPDQEKYLKNKQYGATIRLGAWPCVIKKNTKLEEIYKKYGGGRSNPWYQPNPLFKNQSLITDHRSLIFERHRHRYEFNIRFKKMFEDIGFVFSGTSPDGKLVEAIELKDHPFFIATQFHPEYLSRPLQPHPIFMGFVETLKNDKRSS